MSFVRSAIQKSSEDGEKEKRKQSLPDVRLQFVV